MPKFRYQAFDTDRKLILEDCEADSLQQAITYLESEGLELVSIGLASEPQPDSPQSSTDYVLSTEGGIESDVLRTHLARVLEQGRAIAPALRAYAEEMPSGRRQRQLLTVVDVLERGNPEQAAAELGKLPDYWIPLLSASTSSRDPARVLREFLHESHQADELRRQRLRMVAYPLLILTLAIAILVMLSVFVVPIFRDMFYSFNMKLPWLTNGLLHVSNWISSGAAGIELAILTGVIASLWIFIRLFPSSAGNWLAERFSLPLGRSTALARFAQFTADLLESGLSVPDSLSVAAQTIQRPKLRRAAAQFVEQLPRPFDPSTFPRRSALPGSICYALVADVENNTRVRLLREISQSYADRARMKLSWTSGIVEPIAIGFVGLVVGAVVIALFLPLITLVTKLS